MADAPCSLFPLTSYHPPSSVSSSPLSSSKSCAPSSSSPSSSQPPLSTRSNYFHPKLSTGKTSAPLGSSLLSDHHHHHHHHPLVSRLQTRTTRNIYLHVYARTMSSNTKGRTTPRVVCCAIPIARSANKVLLITSRKRPNSWVCEYISLLSCHAIPAVLSTHLTDFFVVAIDASPQTLPLPGNQTYKHKTKSQTYNGV